MRQGSRYLRVSIGAVCLFVLGCNSPEAPACLKSAGEFEVHEFTFEHPLDVLKTQGHMLVSFETWDSSDVHISVEVHRNLLSDLRMEWDGGELSIGFQEPCQWVRDLSNMIEIHVQSPEVPEFILRGQGECNIQPNLPGANVFIDAYAYAGKLRVACDADTLQVRLHDGVCLAELSGYASLLGCYSSGYSRVDASSVEADFAYITQASIQPMQFGATEYAYVAIESAGDVYGGWVPPELYTLNRTGSGQLKWEHW